MGHKLLSFIGTRRYTESYYSYNGKRSNRPYQFIQEAIVEFFCRNWKEDDQLIVFMTEESRRKNWLSKKGCEDANFDEGLKIKLEKLKNSLGINFKIEEIEIPEGKSEEELWTIFERMNEVLSDDDVVILDVTHSFRYLPMFGLIVLNYVKFLKDVKLERIIYGAMEALGTADEVKKMDLDSRIIPIFDLTPFARLFDWTIAIERFLQTGNAEIMREIAIEELKPLLAETRGEVGGGIRRLVNSLGKFSRDVLTCRSPEFRRNVEAISEAILEAEKELENLRPFRPLFSKIKERFSKMAKHDGVISGLEEARWCLEKGLIQQGLTVLRETIVNYVISEVLKKKDFRSRTYREIAEVMLNSEYEEIPDEILRLWSEIREYRNDINHAGWNTQNYHSSNKFEGKLEEFIERGMRIMDISKSS